VSGDSTGAGKLPADAERVDIARSRQGLVSMLLSASV